MPAVLALGATVLTACASGGTTASPASSPSHSFPPTPSPVRTESVGCTEGEFFWEEPDCQPATLVDTLDLLSGGPPPDGIPPIDAPRFESVEEAATWLTDESPLMVVEVNGDVRAYPLAVMTWHEIANDTIGGVPVVVTYCPLCNSGLAFERTVDGEVLDFGTSGLLYRSNLVMYDRKVRNLWLQFTGQAVVGETYLGTELTRIPSSLLSLAELRESAPDAEVLSRDTGHQRNYGSNPYVGYDAEGADPFLFRGPRDDRLNPMTRVVGLGEREPVAVTLARLEQDRVVQLDVDGEPIVVAWEPGQASALDAESIDAGRDVGQTGAFVARDPNGRPLTFRSGGDGVLTDEETGTTWNLLGRATAGPLAGEQLQAVPHDDTFWFVWFAFRPETRLEAAEGQVGAA